MPQRQRGASAGRPCSTGENAGGDAHMSKGAQETPPRPTAAGGEGVRGHIQGLRCEGGGGGEGGEGGGGSMGLSGGELARVLSWR